MTNITLQQKVSRIDGKLLISPLGKELVMMDIDNGAYLNINEVGSAIWNLLEEPVLVEEVLTQLLQQYEIDEQQCLEELLAFLSTLNDNGLLNIAE